MRRRAPRLYLLALLGALTFLLPFPSFLFPLALLSLSLLPLRPKFPAPGKLVLDLLVLILGPLAASEVLDIPSFILFIPSYPLLAGDLADFASADLELIAGDVRGRGEGRFAGRPLKVPLYALLGALLLAFVLENKALALSSLGILGFLLILAAGALRSLPSKPLRTEEIESSIIVGGTIELEAEIKNSGGDALLWLEAERPWVKILSFPSFLPSGRRGSLRLRLSPPSAGPHRIKLSGTIADKRGLILRRQDLTPLKLTAIPKARYAEWLARRFLEGEMRGGGFGIAASALRGGRGGVEYAESGPWSPGDRLKDLDWKHILKLWEPVVKRFSEAGGRAAIIGARLEAGGEREADELAFTLISSALTLAAAGIPSGLCAWRGKEILTLLPVQNPRRILRKALELESEIKISPRPLSFLDAPLCSALRRLRERLLAGADPKDLRLLELLDLELEALREAARSHPAALGLRKLLRLAPFPVLAILISGERRERGILDILSEELRGRGAEVLLLPPSSLHLPPKIISTRQVRF